MSEMIRVSSYKVGAPKWRRFDHGVVFENFISLFSSFPWFSCFFEILEFVVFRNGAVSKFYLVVLLVSVVLVVSSVNERDLL